MPGFKDEDILTPIQGLRRVYLIKKEGIPKTRDKPRQSFKGKSTDNFICFHCIEIRYVSKKGSEN